MPLATVPVDSAPAFTPTTFFPADADGARRAEGVGLEDLARRFGTPLYVYSRAALAAHYRALGQALAAEGMDHRIHYAVKACSNLAVLQVLARLGAGFDVVSGGELARVRRAGGRAADVVFSGVGKTRDEMLFALAEGIGCFNVESEAELHALSAVATETGRAAPVALRVNPDVDAGTHPYISTGLKDNKFGVPVAEAPRLYALATRLPGLAVKGLSCHIGSQILDPAPFADTVERLLLLLDTLAGQGIRLSHLDIGGGQGVAYAPDEQTLAPAAWAAAVVPRLRAAHPHLKLHTEPGRAIAALAGVLLTRVILLKEAETKNFCVVDAAMNDLLRPTLYDAWMDVVPVGRAPAGAVAKTWEVVGPVCESGDWLARDRRLAVAPGSLLAVTGAGAYGFSMSSNYNTRPRAAEVLVDGTDVHLIRARETLDDLWRGEALLP